MVLDFAVVVTAAGVAPTTRGRRTALVTTNTSITRTQHIIKYQNIRDIIITRKGGTINGLEYVFAFVNILFLDQRNKAVSFFPVHWIIAILDPVMVDTAAGDGSHNYYYL